MSDASLTEEGIAALFADPTGPVGKIMEMAAMAVEGTAKFLVTLPGSGRFYPKGSYFLTRHGKVYHWVRYTDHRASAPGEPPASDTGYLLSKIEHELRVEKGVVIGRVVAKTGYSLYLELGTRYMAPRPFLRPALSAVNAV